MSTRPLPSVALPPELAAFADALLAATLEHRTAPLPEGFASRCTAAQGEAIGALNVERLVAQLGGSVVGTKLGATNPAALTKLGLERPFQGPVLSACVHPSPATLARADFVLCIVECELGVRFGRDVGGTAQRPSRDALADAVDAVFPVIELADCRIEGGPGAVPPAGIAADLGFAGALVTGPAVTDWRGLDLAALAVTLSVNGERIRDGVGAAVMGHPLEALADFVAERGAHWGPVKAGEIVSTGTWTMPYMGRPGDRLVADFGALGRVEATLT